MILEFARNDTDEEEGLNHSGIETFRSNPYESLARECGQNSLDARRQDCIVEMTMTEINVPKVMITGWKTLESTVSACSRKAKQNPNNKKAAAFLKTAELTLQGNAMTFLEVKDSGTTGLRGPAVKGTPFNALVKSSGISEKPATGGLGSYGIGKFAAFAVSNLRTVFYSTMYESAAGKREVLAQGKTILMSHAGADGEEYRQSGYWGENDFKAISNRQHIPEWMRRDELGTTLMIAGFQKSEEWKHQMTRSVLQNFFAAIHDETIRFKIGDIDIRRSNVATLFSDRAFTPKESDMEAQAAFQLSGDLLSCLLDPGAIEKQIGILGIGTIKLRLRLQAPLPKRVGFIRNGMLITDAFPGLKLFPLCRDFIALVEPVGEEINSLLRDMENPAHNEFSPDRITDAQRRTLARKVLHEIATQVRGVIKEHAQSKVSAVVELDDLSEYFRSVPPSGSAGDAAFDSTPDSAGFESGATRRAKTKSTNPGAGNGTAGGGGGQRNNTTTERPAGGKGQGPGTGGTGTRGNAHTLSYTSFRNSNNGTANNNRRTLYFTPQKTCVAQLTVKASGVREPEPLHVVNASSGITKNGSVRVELVDNQRVCIEVALRENYSGPIDLELTEARDLP
jgi:hypothetical protein